MEFAKSANTLLYPSGRVMLGAMVLLHNTLGYLNRNTLSNGIVHNKQELVYVLQGTLLRKSY
jgi:hypothetical protein